MSFGDFFSSFYNLIVSFFSNTFVSHFYLIALAGLGLIYIIKNLIFIGRSSF